MSVKGEAVVQIMETARDFVSEVTWMGSYAELGKMSIGKTFAVVDRNVKWFFHKIRGVLNCPSFDLYASEENKCQRTVDQILDFLFVNNAGKDSTLFSIGGGVTSDITGYVASIYKRGMIWISIPTTLLAQVDASIGGKTAINTQYGKNLIGSFYPPSKVIITIEPTQTWTDDIVLEGLAEIIKILLLFDPSSLESLPEINRKQLDDDLIRRSIELKLEVVKTDPWDRNIHTTLNYGHTFGNAIETLSSIRHGIAVSYGIRIANRIAELMNIMSSSKAEEIECLLNSLKFPQMRNMPPFEKLFPVIKQDKKVVGDNIMMMLIDGKIPIPMIPANPVVPVSTSILKEGYNLAISKNSRTSSVPANNQVILEEFT